MKMLILMTLAVGVAPDRMTEVDRQQQAIWFSSAAPRPLAVRAPALAALQRVGATDDAAGLRA